MTRSTRYSLLGLSLDHLCARTKDHVDRWTKDDAPIALFARHEYGFYCWAPTDTEHRYVGVPSDLHNALVYAHSLGAEYVIFDEAISPSDHPTLPDFSTLPGTPEDYVDDTEEYPAR